MFYKIINFFKRLFGYKVVPVESIPDQGIPNLPTHSPETDGSGIPSINLGKVYGNTTKEYNIILTALVHIRDVVYSDIFRELVLSAKFTNTNGKTNLEIYNMYANGIFVLNIAVFTGSFYQNRVTHTEGYENGDGYIHINRYFINDSLAYGSIMLHELAHQLGFSHESAIEYSSVPYGMNEIFRICAEKLNLKK